MDRFTLPSVVCLCFVVISAIKSKARLSLENIGDKTWKR